MTTTKPESYKMYLDDVRDPYPGYVLVRSVQEAKDYIKEHGYPYSISFDHDLGMVGGEVNGIWIGSEVEAESGYDFAKWLVEQDMDNPWMEDIAFGFNIHSANPVGAANIRGLLSNYWIYLQTGIKYDND